MNRTARALTTLATAAFIATNVHPAHAASDPTITNRGDLGTGHTITVAHGVTGLTVLGNQQHHTGHAVWSAHPMRVMDGGSNVCWRPRTWVQVHGDDPTVGAYTVNNC